MNEKTVIIMTVSFLLISIIILIITMPNNELNCEHFSDEENCIKTKEAIKNNEITICTGLTKEIDKDLCLFNIAIKNKNADLCKSIKNQEIKDECLLN